MVRAGASGTPSPGACGAWLGIQPALSGGDQELCAGGSSYLPGEEENASKRGVLPFRATTQTTQEIGNFRGKVALGLGGYTFLEDGCRWKSLWHERFYGRHLGQGFSSTILCLVEYSVPTKSTGTAYPHAQETLIRICYIGQRIVYEPNWVSFALASRLDDALGE